MKINCKRRDMPFWQVVKDCLVYFYNFKRKEASSLVEFEYERLQVVFDKETFDILYHMPPIQIAIDIGVHHHKRPLDIMSNMDIYRKILKKRGW